MSQQDTLHDLVDEFGYELAAILRRILDLEIEEASDDDESPDD